MKKFLVPLFLVFLIPSLIALDVSGSISGTWSAADSPINVIGEVQIDAGDQLSIGPGVEIIFNGHFKFNIFGRLQALGEENSMITFSALNPETGWHGLRFIDNDLNGQTDSEIRYCQIEDGNATGVIPDYRGGGIYCVNSSELIIDNSIIMNNKSQSAGGGIYLDSSDIIISNTMISDNVAEGSGGGIFILNSAPQLNVVEIMNNSAVYDGGGINSHGSQPLLTRVAITGNTTEWNGGGIAAYNNSNVILFNVTISDNFSPQNGCGIAVLYNSELEMTNSILWDNFPYEAYISNSGELTVDYSDVQGGIEGITNFGVLNWMDGGNINIDPLFINPSNDDYSLQPLSPCIDAGHPDPAYNDVDGTRNDLGAYTYLQAGIRGEIEITTGDGILEEVEITIYEAGTENIIAVTSPNENGIYSVTVSPGFYDVKAYLGGYHPYPADYEDVQVFVQQLTSGIDFQMNQISQGSVYGVIFVEGIGSPADVVISAGEEETSPTYDTVLGIWWYELYLNPGYYDVTASLPSYQDTTVTNVLVQSSQQTSGINFFLHPITFEGYVSGYVQLLGGTGNVEEVEIQVEGSEDIFYPDFSGYYYINHSGGTHNITARLDNYTSVTLNDIVIVEDQLTPDVNFTLINWVPISGTQYEMSRLMRFSLDGQYICNTLNNQVGIFCMDSLGVETCRGIAEWDIDNAYWYCHMVSNEQAGEIMYFKVYESYTDEMYTSYGSVMFEDGTYTDVVYGSYLPSPTREFHYQLDEEWNWISLNLIPNNPSTSVILDPLTPNDVYQIKKQGKIHTYDEYIGWQGELPFLDILDSYKINVHNDIEDFIATGISPNPSMHPVFIYPGYNWIGYLPNVSKNKDDALADLNIPDSLIIKTQHESSIYLAEYGGWTGTLDNMDPGVGYLVYWPSEDTTSFWYPGYDCFEGYEEETRSFVKTDNNQDYRLLKGTSGNMIAMISIENQDGFTIDYNNYDAVFVDSNDNYRAVGSVTNDFIYFTVVGASQNENLSLILINKSTKEEFLITSDFLYEENSVKGMPGSPVVYTFREGEGDVPQIFNLAQNSPNPFNPSTTISYSIPLKGPVKLEIFNIKGQQVETLVDTDKEAGIYSIEWNASNHGSGIYFYKLTTNQLSSVKKCIILK